MALSNKPAVTNLQVGDFGWFIYNNSPVKAKVIKTISDISNPNNDSTGYKLIHITSKVIRSYFQAHRYIHLKAL